MTSMVERAKRNLNETWQTFGQMGHMRAQALRPELADALVRSVIAALREPTEAMCEAGRFRCHGVDLHNGSMRMVCGGYLGETAGEQWKRMIGAALAEGGE